MHESPWDKAIRLAQSQDKLAATLGVTQQTISYYQKKGGPIPTKYWRQLEVVLGMSRQEQRPDDWEAHWPELVAGSTAQAA
ncbi:helix-turn-helix domain-containing protein [Cupriavidus gilardii]|uniref:transcriptional regulator n=1 Tax=Cupriavidus gilardii TaxID=82541 RepID=UPI0021C0866A|nr:helix-turn-helix domain-containing protein [Cupriavidus gilardii]MCT9017107.1 helix-turn-helix domain-containing protein [Cupriavidus gilardii]MCT9056777.1 helix-turn-helix domain-containing protein [Cupriavidus gilardii]